MQVRSSVDPREKALLDIAIKTNDQIYRKAWESSSVIVYKCVYNKGWQTPAGGPTVSRLGLFCKSFIRLCKHQFHSIASPTLEPHNYGGHPSPVPHAPRQLVTYFLSLWIYLLGLFYIVCDLLWMTSFIQHVCRIYPCCRESTLQFFLYAKYRSII